MTEDIGDIISKGFDTWKNNLNICLPFVFSMVITSALLIIIIGSAVFVTIPSLVPFFSNPSEIEPGPILDLLPKIFQSMGIIITAAIIAIILSLFVNAFFTSGAIGMAKEATKSGKTNLTDMKEYGTKKFISLFSSNIIIGLITFAGVIFLIPGILYILPNLSSFPNLPPDDVLIAAIPLLGLGFLAMFIHMIVISLIFFPSQFAIVIDDLGAIQGVKKGFRFFMDHKIDAFLLFIIMGAVMMVPGLFGSIPHVGGILSLAISVIVIQPLVIIWWSRLYLST